MTAAEHAPPRPLAASELASWRALVEGNDLAPFEKKLAEASAVLSPPVSAAKARGRSRRTR